MSLIEVGDVGKKKFSNLIKSTNKKDNNDMEQDDIVLNIDEKNPNDNSYVTDTNKKDKVENDINNKVKTDMSEKSIDNIFNDLFSGSHYSINYFIIDIGDFMKESIDNFELLIALLTKLAFDTNIIIITIFPNLINSFSDIDFTIINKIHEIFTLTDIYIIEKKEIQVLFSILKQTSIKSDHSDSNKLEKPEFEFMKTKRLISRKVKLGLFLNNFIEFTIIEQHPDSNLLLCHKDYNFNFIDNHNNTLDKKDKDSLTTKNIDLNSK